MSTSLETHVSISIWCMILGVFVLLFTIIFTYSLCILLPLITHKKALHHKEIQLVLCINIISCFNVLICIHLYSALYSESPKQSISQPDFVVLLQLLIKYLYFIVFYCACVVYTVSAKCISLNSFRSKHRMITITTGGILLIHCMFLMWNFDHDDNIHTKLQIIYVVDTSWSLMLLVIVSFCAGYVCTIKHVTSQTSSIAMQRREDGSHTKYLHNELKSLSCIASFVLSLMVALFIIDFLTSIYGVLYDGSRPFVCIAIDLLCQFVLCLVICVLFGHQIHLFIRKRLRMDPFLCELSCKCCMYNDNKYDDKYWEEVTAKQKPQKRSIASGNDNRLKLKMHQVDIDESTNLKEEEFEHHILNSVTINDLMLDDVVCDMANDNADTVTRGGSGEKVHQKDETIELKGDQYKMYPDDGVPRDHKNKVGMSCYRGQFAEKISIPIFDIASDRSRNMSVNSPKINI
eukprot:2002_1